MYEKLLDLNNLHEAFYNCQRAVNWKASVQKYECNELYNISHLRRALANHSYKQKPFYEFTINERGKTRHIKSLHISDRVLQRALCDYVLEPVVKNYLIYDNGASIKGKGIEFTRRRLKVHLQRYYKNHGANGYVLLIDFSKYFDNINHDELLRLLNERINDAEVRELLKYLLSTFDKNQNGKGVGIGSQISQIAGIMYPLEIDNFCKIVRGCKYYGRYMDDTYIIHNDKEYLKKLLSEIKEKCNKLGIVINEKKTQIIKLKIGFTFLKMRYLLTESGKIKVIPCRKTIARERQKLKKLKTKLNAGLITKEEIKEQYKSWRGHIIKYNSYKSVTNTDVLYKSLFEG